MSNHTAKLILLTATSMMIAFPAAAGEKGNKMKTDTLQSDTHVHSKKGVQLDGHMDAKTHAKAKMHKRSMDHTQVNTNIDELLQADGKRYQQGDDKAVMARGGEMIKDRLIRAESDNKIKNNTIVVPAVNASPITTVTCPVGTTAQPNMTCLITGDYSY